jgi:poly(A) polymerase
MTAEFNIALKLIQQLDEGFPGTESLIVGGAVRDFLLDVECNDVDIATNIPFDELSKQFELNDITKNTVNAQPVSIITWHGISFEIAAFRSDSSGTDRKNNVATIVDSFEEDSKRRDITINALGINSKNRVVDFVNGRLDLIDRCVRTVGDPNERFAEDATRILRVFRFAAKTDFWIDSNTVRSAFNNRFRLLSREEIAPESIAKEIFKAASDGGASFARFLRLLDENRILEIILPEFTALKGHKHNPIHHPEGDAFEHTLACLATARTKDPVAIIAIAFHDLGKVVTEGINSNTGFPSYFGHEEAGVPIVQAIFDRLKFSDLSATDKDAILFSTEHHLKIHNLRDIRASKLAHLVLNPHWAVIKEVGFADELCRGFETVEWFDEKIGWAEDRVAKIAASEDTLRLKVKEYIDGHKVQVWFPETKKSPKLLRPILNQLAEFILEKLDQGYSPTERDIKEQIQYIITFHLYE